MKKILENLSSQNDNFHLKNILNIYNVAEHQDHVCNCPDQVLLFSCGESLLKFINTNNDKGAFAVINIRNINRTYLYGGAELNIRLYADISDIIYSSLSQNMYYGRVGEKFAIHAWGDNCENSLITTLNAIIKNIEQLEHGNVNNYRDMNLSLVINAGIVYYPLDTGKLQCFRELTSCVMMALSQAQPDNPLSQCYRISKEVMVTIRQKLNEEKALFSSIYAEDFELYYQLQFDLVTNKIYGAEALARWQSELLAHEKTYQYIRTIEKSKHIVHFTLVTLLKISKIIKKIAPELPKNFRFGVNISPAIFNWSHTLLEFIVNESCKNPKLAEHLTLEITESAYIDKTIVYKMERFISKIKKLGVAISIDDFGSGYGALRIISSNLTDCIKLDRELTAKLCKDYKENNYIKLLIHSANTLKLSVLCEGIEHEEQKHFLIKEGVYLGQGFLFHRPMPEKDFIKLLRKKLQS